MSRLLYRLGRFSATHRWTVIVTWLLVLLTAGGSAALFMKPLTNEFNIPGSRFQVVLEQLRTEIPEAAGANGTVVLHSPKGFTDDQRADVVELIETWQQIDGVAAAVDPFVAQEQIDGGQEQLRSGREELEAGAAELAAARDELEAGQDEVDSGRAELEAGREQFEAARDQLSDEMIEQVEAQLATGEEELDQAQSEIDAGLAEVERGEAELAAARAELESGERSAALTDGLRLVSQDDTTAVAQITFVQDALSLDPAVTAAVVDAGRDWADQTGLEVEFSQSLVQDISSIMGPAEVVGLAVAAVVLLVMLGTLVGAGLPLMMALVGVGTGLGGAMALTYFIDMNSATPALALMLGLAVGIDYSLFLINRHRTQLRAGMPVTDSIALSTGTSGNAVTFAGMTVIIALTALTATGIPFLATMGLVAAATVLVAVLVSVTLTPAMLGLVGRRLLPKRGRGKHSVGPDSRGGWAATVQRRPILATLGVLALAALAVAPTMDIRLGLPDGSAEPADSTAYRSYDQIRESFGAGVNGPIVVMAQLNTPAADEAEISATQLDLAEELSTRQGVEYVVPIGISDDLRTMALQLVPTDGPSEEATEVLVEGLQDDATELGQTFAADVGFTGQTVANIDISQQLADALPLYLTIVIGLSLLLLILVFRSILVPVLATAGFLITLVIAFGTVVMIYQWGWLGSIFGVHEPGPILAFLPTLLIGVLFGLAMDYQLFLVSAMREAKVHGESARDAIITGFNHSARVVTAAAIIMISVFGGFVFAHLAMIRPVGFGLAIGVLVDAFLVRMTLTPAVLSLLGEKAWWLPSWLDRILPNVDVEGTALERHLGVDHAELIEEAQAQEAEADPSADSGEEAATRA